MKKECTTKYFGTYSYDEKNIILFESGIFGFEQEKEFILIQLDPNNEDVLCLQSLKDTNLALFIVNPFAFLEEYDPKPSEKELQAVSARNIGDLLFYVICSMTDDIYTSTANLRCPIIVNPHNNKALQIILDNPEYQFRHSFTSFVPEEEEKC